MKKEQNQILDTKNMFIPANLYVYKQIQNTNTYIYIFTFNYIKMDIKMRKPSILDKQLVQLQSLLHLLHWQGTLLVSFSAGFHLLLILFFLLFSDSSVGKESICNGRDPGLIPGWERSTGEE